MSTDSNADVATAYRLTRTQVDSLREAAYDGEAGYLAQRDDAIVTLLYDTGLASSDLVALDVDMVGDDRRELRVPAGFRGVDGVEGALELDPTGTIGTRRLLASYLRNRWRDSVALFPSRKTDRITTRGVRYVVERLASDANVRPYADDDRRGTPSDVSPRTIRNSSPRLENGIVAGVADGPRRSVGSSRTAAVVSGSDAGRFSERSAAETILDTVTDLFYVLDRNGRVRRWNERVPAVTGYADETIAGMHGLEFVVPEARPAIAEALVSVFETGRIEQLEAHLLTADGDRIPYEFNGAPITDDDGSVVGLAGSGRDLTERKSRARDLERYRKTVNAVGDAVYQLDTEGRFVAVNDVVTEVTGYPREALLGQPVSLLLSDEDITESVGVIRDLLSEEGRDVGVLEVEVRTADGETIPAEVRMSLLEDDGEMQGTVGVVRDVSERKARERELRRQRDELAVLNRINAVVRSIDRALVRATSRGEIEQAVCENLVAVEPYLFAWIGDFDSTSERVEPSAWSGVEAGYLDERPGVGDRTGRDVTAMTALETGEVQVAQRIAEDRSFESWCDAALERGYRSAIAVPLTYQDASYGVLCLYAPRPEAFDDRERTVLEELGETIAHAMSAVERRRALLTDTVVELDFRLADPDRFLLALSSHAACELVLNGIAPKSDGSFVAFVSSEEVDPRTVRTFAEGSGVDVSLVNDGDDACLFRFALDSTIASDLADHGGVIREASFEHGKARVTVEFSRDVDVRNVVETVGRKYERSELLARHERERTSETGVEFRSELDGMLTDRQHEVLKTAYLSGFFEWPRASTGEEIAETLGITNPTFHEHVRTGERKLFETYFGQ